MTERPGPGLGQASLEGVEHAGERLRSTGASWVAGGAAAITASPRPSQTVLTAPQLPPDVRLRTGSASAGMVDEREFHYLGGPAEAASLVEGHAALGGPQDDRVDLLLAAEVDGDVQ
jgi:hypothetical protein